MGENYNRGLWSSMEDYRRAPFKLDKSSVSTRGVAGKEC